MSCARRLKSHRSSKSYYLVGFQENHEAARFQKLHEVSTGPDRPDRADRAPIAPLRPRSGPDCRRGLGRRRPRSGRDCTGGPRCRPLRLHLVPRSSPDCTGPDRAPIPMPRSGPDCAIGPDQGAIALSLLALLYKVTRRHPLWCCWGYRLILLLLFSPGLWRIS